MRVQTRSPPIEPSVCTLRLTVCDRPDLNRAQVSPQIQFCEKLVELVLVKDAAV